MAEMTKLEDIRKQAEARLHDVQGTIKKLSEETAHDVRENSHKAMLVSLGSAATTQDVLADLIKWTTDFYERSLKRGQELEDRALKEVRHYWQEGRKRVEAVEDEVEHRVKTAVERLDLPTQAKVENLTAQIDQIESKVGEQIDQLGAKVGEQLTDLHDTIMQNLPIANYGKLNVKEIVNKLADLTVSELHAIRDFETSGSKRATVLRELNRRIEAMPIADYDDLAVEQITAKLDALNTAQLTVIAQYERVHGNRVGVLQSIEARLQGLEMMPA